jgi:hypothetical protein
MYDAFWVDVAATSIIIGSPFFWPLHNVWILPWEGCYYQYGPSAIGPWTDREPCQENCPEEDA